MVGYTEALVDSLGLFRGRIGGGECAEANSIRVMNRIIVASMALTLNLISAMEFVCATLILRGNYRMEQIFSGGSPIFPASAQKNTI